MPEHWYNWHGESCYETRGANGKIRSTTLRDARKLNLLPSVTTISNIVDKPGLHLAKNNMVAEEMFNMFFEDDTEIHSGDLAYMQKESVRRANKHWEDDANTGTIIHDAIESSLVAPLDYNPDQEVWLRKLNKSTRVGEYVGVVNKWLLDNKIEIDLTEVVCVSKEYGYAGKTDVVATYKGEQIIIDWKTTSTKEGQKVKPWDSHPQQIAAYSKALWKELPSYGVNVYLSTTEIDPHPRLEAVWWTKEQLEEAFDTFIATFKLWTKIKKYDPTLNKT